MYFKFRNKEYKVERDSHQFILSQKYKTEKGEEAYTVLGYYSDTYYLIKKLVSLHLIKGDDGKELNKLIHICCKQLGEAVARAVTEVTKGH